MARVAYRVGNTPMDLLLVNLVLMGHRGDDLSRLRHSGASAVGASRPTTSVTASGQLIEASRPSSADPEVLLTHPPRPRKQRRR